MNINLSLSEYVMFCGIWYHLYNLKRGKHPRKSFTLNNATFVKVILLHECFSRSLSCTNGTKLRNLSHINLNRSE